MMRDLFMNIELVVCPQCRADGLALSSAGKPVDRAARGDAPLRRPECARAAYDAGERSAGCCVRMTEDAAESMARPDYISVTDTIA
jgi:pantothenate synthetase